MTKKKKEPRQWIQVGPYRMTVDQVARLMEVDGVSMWMLHEAAASVALDRGDVRTVSLEDLSPEQQEHYRKDPCPNGPHRGPEGPNEDISQCTDCWSVSHRMRPDGHTYGHHLVDCSLLRRHESYCQPGGKGHEPAPTIRGYWPEPHP